MLQEIIRLQFEENTDYNNPGQAVNQMQSLYALSKDLYTDSIRFIYELLQNADDSNIGESKVKVSVRLIGNNLVIAHNGKPFDERDIQGICAVNNGTKKQETDKTGFKGIGFKSVFGQSDKVTVFSSGEYFRFDESYLHDWKWAGTQESWEEQSRRLFKFPWQIIPISTKPEEVQPDIHQYLIGTDFTVATIVEITNIKEAEIAINELSDKVDMFLFLKNIEEINFNLGIQKVIRITPTEENETLLTLNGETKAKYLLKHIVLSVPASVKKSIAGDTNVPEKLKLADNIEISFAAKVGDNGLETISSSQSLLYAYLPTEERRYKLPILVNAAFLTTANRETLHADSAWNQWLFYSLSKELFIWIAELVIGKFSDEAYRLLPEKLDGDNALIKEFNKGYNESISLLPFLLTYENKLVKINEAIIDETFLIGNELFGQDLIRTFVINELNLQTTDLKPFVPHRKYTTKLKKLGVNSFKWINLPQLLASPLFNSLHDVEKNKKLIVAMEEFSQMEKPSEIHNDSLKKWAFLFDHKMKLKSPEEIFFPQLDGSTWDSPDSELSFLHPEILKWLDGKIKLKLWLGELGVVEKSDLTFFHKTILPNVATFITDVNALETVSSIFMLFKRNEINSETLFKLSDLKLFTTQGNLLSAKNMYFSTVYDPILDLQPVLNKDFYLSDQYISAESELSEWKRFFKYFGVQERISITTTTTRKSKITLINRDFQNGYFDMDDKRFYGNHFLAFAYIGLSTSSLLTDMTIEPKKSSLFWSDLIRHNDLEKIIIQATAFWGHTGKPSETTGNKVDNYLKWYIQNNDCLPTLNAKCLPAGSIFLNDERINEIVGAYLPVFDGPNLDADWRSFFGFKTSLSVEDYLSVLNSISEDLNSDNKSRIQKIYEYLLDNITNWTSEVLEEIKEWAAGAKLMDKKGDFSPASTLKHYPDGDNSIFQDRFEFIQLSASNRKHPEISELLALFGVEIIKQNSFKLSVTNEKDADNLSEKIASIIPYWAKWTESEAQSGYPQRKYELETIFEKASFKIADELVVSFGQDWNKEVSVYENENVFHVLTNWKANDVMLGLISKLCDYFKAKRFESELGFLLRSEEEEIIRYFSREDIEIPEFERTTIKSSTNSDPVLPIFSDFKKPIDYLSLWKKNLERNSNLIEFASGDSKTLLLNGLKKQKPDTEVCIYHFSHLENAVTIIKEQQIKSRQLANFKDSAGAGIISQTLEDRKQYARFYFRSHTPTQYYVENWGRGQYSLDHINGEPVCPVPVFFIIPIDEIIESVNWKVSLGTMASHNVQYGNTFDIVSKFDFDSLYKMKSDVDHDRYMAASHQEFLVKDSLHLDRINYRLAVQDSEARNALLIMLNDYEKWEPLISIDPDLFYNENPKIKISKNDHKLSTDFTGKRNGKFVMQYLGVDHWKKIKGDNIEQYNNNGVTTTISAKTINLSSNFEVLRYNLFYCYNGQLWLVDTNDPESNTFDTGYIATALNNWMQSGNNTPVELIMNLKMHPELNDHFNKSIGGPDKLTLQEHTIAVMSNYQKCFNHQQAFFPEEKIFLLFLALHDIGKPKAIALGNRHEQHHHTLEIIDAITSTLPVDATQIEKIKILINEDPIGKYLNPAVSQSLDVTVREIIAINEKFGMSFVDFYLSYIIYYQCDAAGYGSLVETLFKTAESGELLKHPEKNRLLFNDPYETKFLMLEEQLDLL